MHGRAPRLHPERLEARGLTLLLLLTLTLTLLLYDGILFEYAVQMKRHYHLSVCLMRCTSAMQNTVLSFSFCLSFCLS
jgi:hypothetical protein